MRVKYTGIACITSPDWGWYISVIPHCPVTRPGLTPTGRCTLLSREKPSPSAPPPARSWRVTESENAHSGNDFSRSSQTENLTEDPGTFSTTTAPTSSPLMVREFHQVTRPVLTLGQHPVTLHYTPSGRICNGSSSAFLTFGLLLALVSTSSVFWESSC